MGFKLEFNTILSVPERQIDLTKLVVGQCYRVKKAGKRIFPIDIPIDLSGEDYHFVAKVAVRELKLAAGGTELLVEVLKVFDENEAKVISDNFAKQA